MSQHPELLVEDGFYAGLRTPVDRGGSTVGSDLDAGVVIEGGGLRPSHFEIRYEEGRTALCALGGDLLLDDGTALSKGQNMICVQPLSFTAGDTRFAIRLPTLLAGPSGAATAKDEDEVLPSTPVVTRVPVLAGVMVALAVAIIGVSMLDLRSGIAPRTVLTGVAHVSHKVMPTASATEIALGLRGRLDAAGLAAIAVAPARDGSIIVQGSLFPAQMAAWNGVRQWYDTEYGNENVLVNQVVAAGAGPELAVAAVWAGANPYVMDDHGNKLFVGAAVDGGWAIQSILPKSIVLQSGIQKVSIRY